MLSLKVCIRWKKLPILQCINLVAKIDKYAFTSEKILIGLDST